MKKFIIPIIIIIMLIFIKNTAEYIFNTLNIEGTKEKLEKQVVEEERKKAFLTERLYYVETDRFIEEEAKEKLGMLAPGEVIVIAPTEAPEEKPVEFDDRHNWQKWWDLFF